MERNMPGYCVLQYYVNTIPGKTDAGNTIGLLYKNIPRRMQHEFRYKNTDPFIYVLPSVYCAFIIINA